MKKGVNIESVAVPVRAEAMFDRLTAAEQNGNLLEVMDDEFGKPLSMPAVWACRSFFYKLDEKDYEGRYPLISVRALIESLAGNLAEAKRYTDMLMVQPEGEPADDGMRRRFILLSTELVMPYISGAQFVRTVRTIEAMKLPPIQSLTISACSPSIINGFRDFCIYGPLIEKNRHRITASIKSLYGTSGKGVYETALAEWYYQNDRCFDALLLVAGTIPLLEAEDDARCLFVAMALQMKILLMNGQSDAAEPLVSKIRAKIEKMGGEEPISSLNALSCRASMYDGRMERVEKWLEDEAPDENEEIYMMNIYAYLTKIRCYIVTGKSMLAVVLVKRLLHILQGGRRYMDSCECYMLSALICYREGRKEQFIEEFDTAVKIARHRKLYRILGDEGNCMVSMMREYQAEKGHDEFTDRVVEIAEKVGQQFPDYLKAPHEYFDELTASEKSVLTLIATGRTNDEIADMLGRNIGTVKFHSAMIYKKLGVRNRQQAVNRARELGIL